MFSKTISNYDQATILIQCSFISKISKDFFDQDIEAELATYNCTDIASFEKCLQFPNVIVGNEGDGVRIETEEYLGKLNNNSIIKADELLLDKVFDKNLGD